jgi:hypothetical protein
MGTILPVEREITPAKIVILESNRDFGEPFNSVREFQYCIRKIFD